MVFGNNPLFFSYNVPFQSKMIPCIMILSDVLLIKTAKRNIYILLVIEMSKFKLNIKEKIINGKRGKYYGYY